MTTNSNEGAAFGGYGLASIDRRIEWFRERVDEHGTPADAAELAKALALRAVAESLFDIADAIRGRK